MTKEGNYDISRRGNENDFDHLVRLSVDKINKENPMDWTDIKEETNFEHSSDNLRKYAKGFQLMLDNGYRKVEDSEGIIKYKESTQIKADGSYESDKLIALSEEDMKNPNKILEAHGYDPKEFELVSARSSMWNQGVDKTLYSSKINVKPKTSTFDFDIIIEIMKKEIKPVKIKTKEQGEELLSIPFVDMHFGINSFDDYEEKLQDTLEIINSKSWDTIYIPIGHDLIHVNDSKNRTVNGTIIEPIDITKAWKDAFTFYSLIIESALKQSVNVVSDYVPGNHDADMTWGFMQSLEVKFPQVKWNTSMDNKKYFKWNQVLLVSTHGERGLKRVTSTLITKYRDLMVNAKCVEIYSGHIHNQQVSDSYGILVRSLPTSAKEDDWHVSQSFEGSVKNSQIFVYKKDRIKTIYHV